MSDTNLGKKQHPARRAGWKQYVSELKIYRQVISTETKQLRLLAARAATVARPGPVHLKRILLAAEPFANASGPVAFIIGAGIEPFIHHVQVKIVFRGSVMKFVTALVQAFPWANRKFLQPAAKHSPSARATLSIAGSCVAIVPSTMAAML